MTQKLLKTRFLQTRLLGWITSIQSVAEVRYLWTRSSSCSKYAESVQHSEVRVAIIVITPAYSTTA
jgi:hypothetical protein